MAITELLPSHKDYLMFCLVRNDKVLLRALNALDVAHFDPDTEKHMAVIWLAVKEHWTQFQKLPPKILLKAEVDKRVAGDSTWSGNPFLVTQINDMIEMAYAISQDDLDPNAGIAILQKFLDERVVRPILTSGPDRSMPDMVRDIHSAFVRTRLTVNDSVDVFDLSRREIGEISAPRTATGFAPFDLMLNGGPRKGDMVVVLGPQGGGKTMLGIMSALSNAFTNDEYTLFLTYEQPVDPEVRDRMWIAAANVPRNEVEGFTPPDLPPPTDPKVEYRKMKEDVWDKIKKASAKLRKMRVVDMSGAHSGHNGMPEVEAIVQQEIQQGRQPGAVIIDWAGVMARRYNATLGNKPDQLRHVIMMIADGCKQLANKYNCWVVLLHQLNADGGKKSVSSDISQYDSSEASGIGQMATAVITITSMDKEKMVCRISNPKARCGGDGKLWVKIDNVRHQMTLESHEYIQQFDRAGNAVLVDKKSMDHMADATAELPPHLMFGAPPPAAPATK